MKKLPSSNLPADLNDHSNQILSDQAKNQVPDNLSKNQSTLELVDKNPIDNQKVG